MCGIAGRVVARKSIEVGPTEVGQMDVALVRAMSAALAHRGPDDEGLVVREGCALAHRRLSIVDLAGGHQPLSNEDGTVWVVYNGEIYNHGELRKNLQARGHVFRTRSDTEVIVHAYEEDGPRCVERFRGMFAFALWDTRRRRLVLARDRLGIKPLYYTLSGSTLSFASELKALLADPGLDRSIDEDALSCYLALRYVPAPATLLSSVRKLPPATLLVWDEGRVRFDRYWDLASTPVRDALPMSEAEAAIELRERIDDCVEMRLMSEVPLGAFLSGGLDSTMVTAAMQARRGAHEPIRTFAVGYGDAAHLSELPWARLAAERLGTAHHEVAVDSETAVAGLPDIVWALDEPIADPAAVPLYFLSRRTRESVTVVLSGEGGDEMFAGYAAYRWMLRMEALRGRHRGPVLSHLAALLPSRRLGRAGRLLGLPLEERYRGVSRAFDDLDHGRLRGGDGGAAGLRAVAAALAPHWERTRGMSPLRRMLYLDTCVWLPDDLLMKADKITMSSALELRVPLLDHRLAEYAWSLPDHHKLRGDQGKWLLRRAARGRVPEEILTRPKQGFETPTAFWLRRPLVGLLCESLLGSSALGRGRFERRELEALITQHGAGQDRTPELWALLVLELWHRRLREERPLSRPVGTHPTGDTAVAM